MYSATSNTFIFRDYNLTYIRENEQTITLTGSSCPKLPVFYFVLNYNELKGIFHSFIIEDCLHLSL